MTQLVLASSSRFRRKVLEDAGLAPRCVDPAIDEHAFTAPDPSQRAVEIARGKAAAVVLAPGEVGIAADQVAYDPLSGEIFGKPADDEQQVQRLLSLCGRTHELYTGWVVYGADWSESGVVRSRITMREVSEGEIRDYVATGEARGCAGGYAVEGRGSFLIDRIDGDWFNVIGLPIYTLYGALRAHGWRFEDA